MVHARRDDRARPLCVASGGLRRGAVALVVCVAAVALGLGAAGCRSQRQAADAAVRTPAEGVAAPPPLPASLGLGRPATRAELAAVDIDANPAGAGLPAGRGTAEQGAAVYARKCAVCHGASGEGKGTYPKLVGREPRLGFPFGNDPKLVKTIGNYWPYATTLYDYIHRAMPSDAPGSLMPDEVYGVVAFLLAANEIIPRGTVIDARTLPGIRMPARDRFVPDDRHGGRVFR